MERNGLNRTERDKSGRKQTANGQKPTETDRNK